MNEQIRTDQISCDEARQQQLGSRIERELRPGKLKRRAADCPCRRWLSRAVPQPRALSSSVPGNLGPPLLGRALDFRHALVRAANALTEQLHDVETGRWAAFEKWQDVAPLSTVIKQRGSLHWSPRDLGGPVVATLDELGSRFVPEIPASISHDRRGVRKACALTQAFPLISKKPVAFQWLTIGPETNSNFPANYV